jgi:hypothetical protein
MKRRLIVGMIVASLSAGVAGLLTHVGPVRGMFAYDHLTVLQRYLQRSPCHGDRLTEHPMLILKPISVRFKIDAAASIELDDPDGAGKVIIDREPGWYFYRDRTFDGRRFPWRENCVAGWWCQFNVNYYVHQFQEGKRDRIIHVRLIDKAGQVLDDIPIAAHIPTRDEFTAAQFPDVQPRLEPGRAVARFANPFAKPTHTMIQLRDDRGWVEREVILGPGEHREWGEPIQGKLLYAGLLAYKDDDTKPFVSAENKVELMDQDEHYRCW